MGSQENSLPTVETPQTAAPDSAGPEDMLDEVRTTARDQLEAAWQLHVERVEERLAAGWREHIAQVLEERFSELAARLDEEVERRVARRLVLDLETELTEGKAAIRRELSRSFNEIARRLRQSEDAEQLSGALLEAAANFCQRAALFRVSGQTLRLERAAGLGEEGPPGEMVGVPVPLSAAPSFRNAVESLDTVVAAHGPAEISEVIASGFPAPPDGEVCLVPLVSRGTAVAVLYAVGGEEPVDRNALELLSVLAAAVLDGRLTLPGVLPEGLAAFAGMEHKPGVEPPEWASLSKEDRDMHLRAQRLARVQVAEWRLYKSQAVKEGRAAGNLYDCLKGEIDTGREVFRSQYMTRCASMIDYLHLELVRTLANDDEVLLGPDYPGPLV